MLRYGIKRGVRRSLPVVLKSRQSDFQLESHMITLFFDGLCMPKNPGGVATYGYVIYSDGKKLKEGWGFVGAGMFGDDVTNNVAEYFAIIKGLESALSMGHPDAILIKGDSRLVIEQLSGRYAVRSPRLNELHRRAKELLGMFKSVSLEWVPRGENSEADALSRRAFNEFVRKHRVEYENFYSRR